LAEWKSQYENGGKPSAYSLCVKFNSVKDEIAPFARDVPYAITESAFQNLGKAFKNFFRRVKGGEKKVGYPKFKKKGQHSSFQLRGVKVFDDRVYIPLLGNVRLKERSYIPIDEEYGVYATISERAGRWFVSILVKNEDEKNVDTNKTVIGVDFGINHLVVISNGKIFDSPKPLRNAQTKLGILNRELSRRKLGGENRKKTRAKLAKAHADIANIRTNTLHEISDYIVNDLKPSIIVLEDLNVSGMMQNHCLALSISDMGFYELRRKIEYKASKLGIKIVIANRWFPSSKMCNVCGAKNDDLKLSDRIFKCPHCGHTEDRDLHAAKNLAAYGLKAETQPDCLGS
jgi:putative transposase